MFDHTLRTCCCPAPQTCFTSWKCSSIAQRGNGFQDVAYLGRHVRAEVGCPTAVLIAKNHHADLAADQLGGCQERLVLTGHLDTTTIIGDRLPALPMPGAFRHLDVVLAINAVAVRTRGRQIKQTGVLAQAADDDDAQAECGEQKRPRCVAAIDRQPHRRLHPQRGSTA